MAMPDSSTLTSSSQVFTSCTLPQIRAIHKELHVRIDDKAARLRSQVGNSYRDLLGTADTIVQMRQDMTDVQAILGRMGSKCGWMVVGSKLSGLGKFLGRDDAEAVLGQTARLKLLEASRLSVGILLKGPPLGSPGSDGRGEGLVLAAKILLLGRLLIAGFGDASSLSEETRVAVDAAKKSLRSLKARLLRGITKALVNMGQSSDQGDILNALCAYSLASNSGAKDAMWHFLKVRAEAISMEFSMAEHDRQKDTDNVIRGLDLYSRTLLHIQSLVPTKLSDALAGLKRKPLLEDESMQAVQGLRLDTYGRWCSDDIHYFTPFIRHGDLDAAQAEEMLSAWATKEGQTFLQGLGKTLGHMTEFKAIVDMRTKVLQRWVKEGGKAKGFDPSVMLHHLRNTLNARLLDVLHTKVSKLRLVGSEVAATLEAWQPGMADRRHSLWDEEMLDMDLSNGSAQVTQTLLSRLHGRDGIVSRAVMSYRSWYQLIDRVGDVVEQLRRQRWDNDVDDIEDEQTIEARQRLLSGDDPQLMHDQLHTALDEAYRHLQDQLASLWQSHEEGPNCGPIAMYLLRVLRHIRTRLPPLESTKTFGLQCVPSLQEKLAAQVSISPVHTFATTVLTRTTVTGRALWEGEPALPTQPSAGAFRLLRNLTASMGDAGLDLWTPSAVAVLKRHLGAQLREAWRQALTPHVVTVTAEVAVPPASGALDTEAKDEGEQVAPGPEQDKDEDGGDRSTGATEPVSENMDTSESVETAGRNAELRRDLYIAWLYDVLLLQLCLGLVGQSPNQDMVELGGEMHQKTGLDNEARERMARSTLEYWKRTSLLFGLIA